MRAFKTFAVLLLAAACGALGAEYVQKFDPPKVLSGGEVLAVGDCGDAATREGKTYIFVGSYTPERWKTPPPGKKLPGLGVLFYRRGEFLFSIRQWRLCFQPENSGTGNWELPFSKYALHPAGELREGDNALHHFALTLKRTIEPEQGLDYTDAAIYVDGALAGSRRYDNFVWKPLNHPLLAGGVEPDDRVFEAKHWNYTGEVAAAEVLDRALAETEIQARVLADKRLKPRFTVPAELTAEDRKLLTPPAGVAPEVKARFSALANAAKAGRLKWRTLLDGAPGKVYTLIGTESAVILLNDGNEAAIASFYDLKADREFLAWNNPFFEVTYLDTSRREYTLSGLSRDVSMRLEAPPELKDGAWSFTLAGENRPSKEFPFRFEFTMKCRFIENRLEYALTVRNDSDQCRLHTVKFPSLRFNSIPNGKDTLLVPCMSGVEYKNAAATCANYSDFYARGRCSLQMGAYYDPAGGVLFMTEDPRGCLKRPSFAVGKRTADIDFEWDVPFRDEWEHNIFDPKCAASATIFRGDWYDAGLLYREMLARIRAPWWIPEVPNPECPNWFRETAIAIGPHLSYTNYGVWLQQLDDLAKWKKYVGAPQQMVRFYTWCLHFTRDWPHHPTSPDFVDRMRALHEAGYRVIPYLNARIWEEKDKRDEDYRFTKVGLPATVRTIDGKPFPSWFGRQFYVICPATETYEKEMFRECGNCIVCGADGAYLDQIGAGTNVSCYSDEHGHLRADPEIWYGKGHYKVFRKLREHWKSFAPDAATMGEDHCETVVGNLDGGVSWRWIYDGQVGLFPLIFSGRTQFVGLDWNDSSNPQRGRGRDLDAAPAKLTFMLFNNMILGSFSIGYLKLPGLRPHRVLIKQYAHLRTAMLDFFNRGMMARPPRWAKPQQPVSRFWSIQGSKNVATEPLQACAWECDGVKAILVANTDAKRHENVLETPAPKGTLHLFFSRGGYETRPLGEGGVKLPVSLDHHEFIAVLVVPEGRDAGTLPKRFRDAFSVIAGAYNERDPWDEDTPKP